MDNEKKTEATGIRLSASDRAALLALAAVDDRKPAAIIRALIRREAKARGLWRDAPRFEGLATT